MVKLYFLSVMRWVSSPVRDKELNAFIDKAGDIDEELPTKQRSAKLKKEYLTHYNSYHKYLRDHCFEGLYAFQVRQKELYFIGENLVCIIFRR